MKWESMAVKSAVRAVTRMKEGTVPEFELKANYLRMQQRIHEAWAEANAELKAQGGKSGFEYARDLNFGLRLYRIFSRGEFAMSPRIAADLGIWRFISIKVVPDLIKERWPKVESWDDRFYKKTNRVYLKVLWWYIYLSWQGDEELTYERLKDNSEDTIAQLVERSGAHGYNPGLYREIMRQFYLREKNRGNMDVFRKVMKLHTARIQTRQPELLPGGIGQYVEELYDYFKK